MNAALDLKTKTLKDVMTPINKVFMLNINQPLDESLKRQIYERGYSRIPIFEGTRENIVGLLLTRDLILANLNDGLTTIHQLRSIFVRHDLQACDHSERLHSVLSKFKENDLQIVIVTEVEPIEDDKETKEFQLKIIDGLKQRVIGIVTREDIIEDILQEDIKDEGDLQETRQQRNLIRQ